MPRTDEKPPQRWWFARTWWNRGGFVFSFAAHWEPRGTYALTVGLGIISLHVLYRRPARAPQSE